MNVLVKVDFMIVSEHRTCDSHCLYTVVSLAHTHLSKRYVYPKLINCSVVFPLGLFDMRLTAFLVCEVLPARESQKTQVHDLNILSGLQRYGRIYNILCIYI